MIPQSEWVWYGYAGHFIASRHCAFHLTTRIGRCLVSTVGNYILPGEDRLSPLGLNPTDYFETMVFRYHGETRSGNPEIDLTEMHRMHIEDSVEAEQYHRDLCLRVAAGEYQEDAK